jgi:hypothetical protein
MARAALDLKQTAQSREHLEKARAAVRTPEQSESVQQLASLIERGSAVTVGSPDAVADTEPDPGRPTLRRKSPPPAKKN